MAVPFKALREAPTEEEAELKRCGSHAEVLFKKGFFLTAAAEGTKGWLYDNWQHLGHDLSSVKELAKKYPKHGIGIQGHAHFITIDVDVDDEVAAETILRVLKEAFEKTGQIVIRIGQFPRFAIFVNCTEPIKSFKLHLKAPDGSAHKLEIIGKGGQVVAFNRHETTGKEYYYPETSLLDIEHADDLITVTDRDELEGVLRNAVDEIGGGWSIKTSANDEKHVSRGSDELTMHNVPSQFTNEQVLGYMADIKPSKEKDYDRFIRVGMALHHHFDGSNEGYEIWVKWSSQSPQHCERLMPKWWNGFGKNIPDNPITAATLCMYAKEDREKRKLNNSVETFRTAEALVNNFKDEQALLSQIPSLAKLLLVPHHESALVTLVYDKIKELSGRDPGLKNIEKLFHADKGEQPQSDVKNPRLPIVRGIERALWGIKPYVNQDGKVCLEDSSKGYVQNYLLDSEGGKNCLINIGRRRFNKLLDSAAILAISGGIKANSGELQVHQTGRRWLALGANCYAGDVGNREHNVYRVEPGCYTVSIQREARFIRNGLERELAIVSSNQTGNYELIWKYIRVVPWQRMLVLAWILEAMRPDTPFPLLALVGLPGSAKTFALRVLQLLIDPQTGDVSAPPSNDRDLRANAASSYFMTMDNVIKLSFAMQVTLCLMATGGNDREREMRENHKTVSASLIGPFVLSCLSLPHLQPDVIQRLIVGQMLVLSERRSEQEIWAEFNEELPDIQAGLLTLFSQVLQKLPDVSAYSTHRMADFCRLGQSLLEVLGIDGSFANHLETNNHESRGEVFEGEPALVELQRYMHIRTNSEPLDISATDLWEILTVSKFPSGRPANVPWPKTGQTLFALFDRNLPALQEAGVDFERLEGSRPRVARFSLNANALKDFPKQPKRYDWVDRDFEEIEKVIEEIDKPGIDFSKLDL